MLYTSQVELNKERICQVCAVSKVRESSRGEANQGIMLKDIETKETFWVNFYILNKLQYGDFVKATKRTIISKVQRSAK